MSDRTTATRIPPLHLTRRGRLVLIGLPAILVTAALLALIGFFTAPAVAAGSAPELPEVQRVSLNSGASLWSLATTYAPQEDPRDVVAHIVEMNNLAGAVVPAGSQLFVPVSR